MEPFGSYERNWTEEEKEKITNLLKYDKHVPLNVAEMVFSAEVEASYFKRLSYLVGGVASGLFFYFPIVRNQPAFRRVLISALPGAYTYTWGQTVYEEAKWIKTHAAYQKFITYHGQHSKLFV